MTKKEKRNNLNELATKLSINLANSSLIDLMEKNQENGILANEVIKDIFVDEEIVQLSRHTQERFIVIVGAGASYNASQHIPLGKIAAETLKDCFENISDLVDNEIDKLSTVYRLEPEDFETILLAISKFRPKKLVDELVTLYNHKYYPSLSYEILAHLFKHRFVDVIINYNFDEILDMAIEDEMLHSEYYSIITDGDVQNVLPKLLTGGPIKSPLYIKPHGTASHKSSLRFTREDYFGLPVDIENILKLLLSGTTKIENFDEGQGEVSNPLAVNLIVIGFGMQSFELNHIIKECLPKKSNIYHFNMHLPSVDEKLENVLKAKQISYKNLFKINDGNQGLNFWMEKLWNFIDKNFEESFKPRSIDRHKLISELFENRFMNIKGESEKLEYLKDRTHIELVLSIAKYKGFLNVNQLSKDRFGKYYSEYRRLNKGPSNPSLINICESLGLKDIGYSRQALKDESLMGTDNLTFPREKIDGYLENLYDRLLNKNVLSASLVRKLKGQKVKALFLETLKALNENEDTEIQVKKDTIYDHIFSNPLVTNSNLALGFMTMHLFEVPEWDKNIEPWDAIFIIAETGEWIINKVDMGGFEGKEVRIIVADESFNKPLRQKLVNCKNYEIRDFNWWQHNQHMTIFLKNDENGKLVPIKSIYFTRRLRNTYILPVILDEVDSKIILETFAAYHINSGPRKKNNLDRNSILKELNLLLSPKRKYDDKT